MALGTYCLENESIWAICDVGNTSCELRICSSGIVNFLFGELSICRICNVNMGNASASCGELAICAGGIGNISYWKLE